MLCRARTNQTLSGTYGLEPQNASINGCVGKLQPYPTLVHQPRCSLCPSLVPQPPHLVDQHSLTHGGMHMARFVRPGQGRVSSRRTIAFRTTCVAFTSSVGTQYHLCFEVRETMEQFLEVPVLECSQSNGNAFCANICVHLISSGVSFAFSRSDA